MRIPRNSNSNARMYLDGFNKAICRYQTIKLFSLFQKSALCVCLPVPMYYQVLFNHRKQMTCDNYQPSKVKTTTIHWSTIYYVSHIPKTNNYQPSTPKTNLSKPAPPHPILGDCSGFTKHHWISNNDVLFSANVS